MNPGGLYITPSHTRDLGPGEQERAVGAGRRLWENLGSLGLEKGQRQLLKSCRVEKALLSVSQLEQIGNDSKQALQQLQAQLEDYKEKARREVADAQRQAKEWASEAEKTSGGLSRLQDEVEA